MIWKLRRIAAWGCRSIGVIVSFYLMVVLLRALAQTFAIFGFLEGATAIAPGRRLRSTCA